MRPALETARAAVEDGTIDVLASDLDGVLRRFDPGLWGELDAELGVAPGTTLRSVLGHPFLTEVIHGRGTHAQWREEAVEALVSAGAGEREALAAVERWASTPGEVDQDVAGLLRRARSLGLGTFVFTNGTDRVPAELVELGLADVVGTDGRHLLNTADLGAVKPHETAFAAAHARLEQVLGKSIPRDRVLFLDDTPSHVDGARAFGWQVLLWA